MSTFHLYIIGRFAPDSELATLAEFEGSRAVERVAITSEDVASLTKLITDLRVFIEAGAPPFDNKKLEALGRKLFDFLITGNVRRVLDAARGSRDRGLLPLELFLEDDVLAGWPWEYLFDDDAHSFLCQEFHPISRGIFSIVPRRKPKPVEGKIRLALLLGVRSGDRNTTPQEEVRWIENVFGQKLKKDSVETTVLQGATYSQLEEFLSEKQFHILHFFGHARFDMRSQSGYLRFDSADGTNFRLPARQFATMVMQHQNDTRLVFLNACESGRTSADNDPARSSIAAALVELGVPAVVATQFSIPDASAHYLSSNIYNALAIGMPLVEAMTLGRRAMQFAGESQFFDWGIPVLYASDPSIEVFPIGSRSVPLPYTSGPSMESSSIGNRNERGGHAIEARHGGEDSTPPSIRRHQGAEVVAAQTHRSGRSRLRVALVDLDIKAGFLPELVQQANAAQTYFSFEVAYLPLPSGAVLTKIGREKVEPQLFLPRVEEYLKDAPTTLGVDRVTCLTGCLIAGEEDGDLFYNYFASPLDTNPNVSAISAADLREFAAEAGVEFSKAVLYLCLGQLVVADERSTASYHKKTYGCLLDECEIRDDIVTGLRKMRFDHHRCRNQIKDKRLLAAIDALLAL